MTCFTFDNLILGSKLTNFIANPAPTNTWSSSAGTAWGVSFTWSNGISTPNGEASIVGPGVAGSTSQSANVNNIMLCFGAKKQEALASLTFDYWFFGGNLNLMINGVFQNFGQFMDMDGKAFDTAIASVTSTSMTGGDSGTVKLTGVIDLQYFFGHIGIGGQELFVDNICWELPGPS